MYYVHSLRHRKYKHSVTIPVRPLTCVYFKKVKNVRFSIKPIFTLQIFPEFYIREVLSPLCSRRRRTHLFLN